MNEANHNIDGANVELNKADKAQSDANNKKADAASDENEAKSKQSNAPTQDNVFQQSNFATQSEILADGHSQEIQQTTIKTRKDNLRMNRSVNGISLS